MKTSDVQRKRTEHWEGLFFDAYDDYNDHVVLPGQRVHGTLTIGYGHTSDAGPPRVYVGMIINAAQADAILSKDLIGVELEVEHLIKVPLNQNQFDALVDFQFNTGWLDHPNCSLKNNLNSGNYNLADEDFALYDRASGKILKGLEDRRAEEAKVFRTPMPTSGTETV